MPKYGVKKMDALNYQVCEWKPSRPGTGSAKGRTLKAGWVGLPSYHGTIESALQALLDLCIRDEMSEEVVGWEKTRAAVKAARWAASSMLENEDVRS